MVAHQEKKLCKENPSPSPTLKEESLETLETQNPKFFKLIETRKDPNVNIVEYSSLLEEKVSQRRTVLALNKSLENKAARYKIVNFNRNLHSEKNVSVLDVAREEDAPLSR